MFSIETGAIEVYQQIVTSAVVAFLPLLTVTIGIFLAFAIFNSLRFYILKMVK